MNLKSIFSYLTMFTIVLLLGSCDKKENEGTKNQADKFAFTPNELSFKSHESYKNVQLLSESGDWTLTSKDAWVKLDPASGKASKNATTVTVFVDKNETNKARETEVTAEMNGEKIILVVKQEGNATSAKDFGVAKSNIEIPANATSADISINGDPDVAWTASIVGTLAGVSLSKENGTGPDTIILTVPENNSNTETKTYDVLIKTTDKDVPTAKKSHTVKVTQAAKPIEMTFDVTPLTKDIEANTTTVNINITGNVAWTIASVTGLNFNKQSGTGASEVIISLSPNATNKPIKYTFTVVTTDEGITPESNRTKTVTITQEAATAKSLSVDNENISATAEETSKTIQVTAENVTWTASCEPSAGVSFSPAGEQTGTQKL